MDLSSIPTNTLIAELARRRDSINSALDSMRISSSQHDSINAVITAVCSAWDMDKETLFSRGRPKVITEARQAAMEIMRNHLFLTYEAVATVFSKDHCTVIHACNSHDSRMMSPDFKRRYKAALNAVKSYSLQAAGFEISTH